MSYGLEDDSPEDSMIFG